VRVVLLRTVGVLVRAELGTVGVDCAELRHRGAGNAAPAADLFWDMAAGGTCPHGAAPNAGDEA